MKMRWMIPLMVILVFQELIFLGRILLPIDEHMGENVASLFLLVLVATVGVAWISPRLLKTSRNDEIERRSIPLVFVLGSAVSFIFAGTLWAYQSTYLATGKWRAPPSKGSGGFGDTLITTALISIVAIPISLVASFLVTIVADWLRSAEDPDK
jgi:hypothetical protein